MKKKDTWQYSLIKLNGIQYISGVSYVGKKETILRGETQSPIGSALSDEHGNYLFYLDSSNKISNSTVVLSYIQLYRKMITDRQMEYFQTDKLFIEAQYDGTSEKLKEWKDAVKAVKEKYPKPVKEKL